VLFLVAWELMALSAYFLIVFDHDRIEVRRAGMVYLVLTHIGTLALFGMFLLWGRTSSELSFANLTPAAAHLVGGGAPILLLSVIGFGIKAGIFPFHLWLPGAHASAPSHISALLSGVMIKTGIYGLLRVLTLFGPPPGWWAWTLLALGLASAVCGVLWALTQRDLKRALAYSSVDNVGIILMGVGLGALGSAYHRPTLALLGFSAALLHALNHALFKSLLFLGAGAIAHTTGTLQLDRLGGLARVMPRTAWAFLLGSIAIVGLPPLNGFVGEWTLIRGFLAAAVGEGSTRFAGLGAAVVGLVGALTLACFLRLGTAIFLGQPRSGKLEAHQDATHGMTVGYALLGFCCLLIGVAPGIAVSPALRVAAMVSTEVRSLAPDEALGSAIMLAITTLVVSLVILIAALWGIRHALGRRRSQHSSTTWGCGYSLPTGRMQYTASSFSAPVARAFAMSDGDALGRAMSRPDADRDDRVLRGIAMPAWQHVARLALQLRPLQQGRVTTYLQYMIVTVLLLLGFLYVSGLATPR
jgi:formate hydrogenlyase subunit 3/multisubunit Na+/H+ antiporter MnhD subunit